MSIPHYSWPNSDIKFFQDKVIPTLYEQEKLFQRFDLFIKEDSQLYSTLFFKYFSNEVSVEWVPSIGSFKLTTKENKDFGFFWGMNNEIQFIGQLWQKINPIVLQGKLLPEMNEFCERLFYLINSQNFMQTFSFIEEKKAKLNRESLNLYLLKNQKNKKKNIVRVYIQSNGLIRKIDFMDPFLRKVPIGTIGFGQMLDDSDKAKRLLITIKKLGFSLSLEILSNPSV